MRKRHHYYLLVSTLLLTAVALVLIPRVNVNSDMTQYLPEKSQMKQGLSLLQAEFGDAQVTGADVKVMFHGLEDASVQAVADSLAALDDVEGVDFRQDESGDYTLYELNVPKTVDQKSLGQFIARTFGHDAVVETSQDGNTPSVSVLLIAIFLIVFILVLTAQSWLDPLLFLTATGIAVALNIGSNALLSSVSITTNYIGAILQMVLSLDYSIVLINRFRQELSEGTSAAQAVNRAIRKAWPSLISSALTTVVGLSMLCFMRLKIGMDIGLVLAKGVVWSLICSFTVLPSLLILCENALKRTAKKSFVMPTDRIGRYATRFKVPLSLLAFGLFVVSFFFSRKTEISFALTRESEIGKVFRQLNPMVVIYDTQDEMAVMTLADSLAAYPGVEAVVSYPGLLKRPYTADEMAARIGSMAAEFSGLLNVPLEGLEFLTPEVIRLVYSLKYTDNRQLKLTFPEFARFTLQQSRENPLFVAYTDKDMREKLELFEQMSGLGAGDEPSLSEPLEDATPAPATTMESKPESGKSSETRPDPVEAVLPSTDTARIEELLAENATTPAEPVSSPAPQVNVAPAATKGDISIVSFMPALYQIEGTEEARVLATIVDTARIRRKMTIQEMAEFIGSTPYQTKMVYSFSKSESKTMTPLEYVHFLADDLFKRKALASFVNDEQRRGLLLRTRIMDYANADAHLSAQAMNALLAEFGVAGMSEDRVEAIAFPRQTEALAVEQRPAVNDTPATPDTSVWAEDRSEKEAGSEKEVRRETSAQPAPPPSTGTSTTMPKPAPARPAPVPPKPKKTLDEYRAEWFADMMYSGKSYTSGQLARQFARLGYPVDPDMLSLLYDYYACARHYDESLTMSAEQLLAYAVDTLLHDNRLTTLVDEETRSRAVGVRGFLNENIGRIRRDEHSLFVVLTDLPLESPETYAFIDYTDHLCDQYLSQPRYTVGESVMYSEMKRGMGRELSVVTILTVLAIFLIVALTFRSLVVPVILVMTVMTAVYVNVIFSGVFSDTMLYLAYLIVQSILMGATIDYGILFTNYYKEYRATQSIDESIKQAYRGSIRTIMTSGLIMAAAPGVMSLLVDDPTISAIVGSIAIGAMVAIVLLLTVLPGVLAALDRWVVHGGRKN